MLYMWKKAQTASLEGLSPSNWRVYYSLDFSSEALRRNPTCRVEHLVLSNSLEDRHIIGGRLYNF